MSKSTKVGCASAVLIHLVLLLLMIVWGAVLGSAAPNFGATGSGGTVERGAAGSSNAIETFLTLYVLTLGIVPTVISIVGFGLGWLVMEAVSRGPWPPKKRKALQTATACAVLIHPLLFCLVFAFFFVIFFDVRRPEQGVAGGVSRMKRFADMYLASPASFLISSTVISLVGFGMGWAGAALRSSGSQKN